MNNQKGITLIALIITIIVMLIIVGVTINVALNGGLFEKARTASTQTQREIEREQLISTMLGAYNSRGKFVIGDVETLPDGAKWCNEDDTEWNSATVITPTGIGDWVITKTNNKFYIDEDGTVLDDKPTQTTNVWKERGLTSGNVTFDKVYHAEEDGDNIILYSNGSFIWDEDITDPDNIIPSSDIQDGIESEPESYIIGSNYVLIQYDILSSYFAIVFENNGVLNVYDARINDADFELSSIIANDTDGGDEFVLVDE